MASDIIFIKKDPFNTLIIESPLDNIPANNQDKWLQKQAANPDTDITHTTSVQSPTDSSGTIRFFLEYGQIYGGASGSHRSELRYLYEIGQKIWISFWIYFPSDYQIESQPCVIMQTHNGPWSPPFSLRTLGTEIYFETITGDGGSQTKKRHRNIVNPIVPGTWYHFSIKLKLSPDPLQAITKLWVNRELKLNFIGANYGTGLSFEYPPTWKIGLYPASWSSNVPDNSTMTVFYDKYRLASWDAEDNDTEWYDFIEMHPDGLPALSGIDEPTEPPGEGPFTLTLSSSNTDLGTVSRSVENPITAGGTVQLTATPIGSGVFNGWYEGSVSFGNLISTNNPHTITMNSNRTIIGSFSDGTPVPPEQPYKMPVKFVSEPIV